MQILVIEDDADFRKMLKIMLQQAGYDVFEAANGREGLNVYCQEQIDLVITDIFMPEKEGMQTVMELMEQNPDAKIIAISGGGSRDKLDYLESIKDSGVQMTFTKPFIPKAFLAGVKDLLSGSQDSV